MLLQQAEVYLFDEPSSFLDVAQRLKAARAIRTVAADAETHVVAVEHDLSLLGRVHAGATLHHALGLAWVRAKDYERAEIHFAEAASWAPEDPRNPLMHGLCVAQLEDPGRAVSILENGLANHPADVDLTLALVESLRPLGRLDEGLARVTALRSLRPDRPDLEQVEQQLRAELGR